MVTTYTLEDVTSIDEVKTFSDSALTVLVETLTPANFTKTATGIYLNDDAFTYASYTLGVIYYIKITWTPSGAAQRSDSFAFGIAPQGQAAGSASVTDTDCRHGKHLEAPVLLLRLARGGYRESDFENGNAATRDRLVQDFTLPESVESEEVHLVVSSGRAGAPVALEYLTGDGETLDTFAPDAVAKPNLIQLPAPLAPGGEGGYRGAVISKSHYLRLSRNLTVSPDIHRTRYGYSTRRIIAQATATFLKRYAIDEADGTFHAAFQLGGDIFEDAASPTDRGNITNPYGATTNRIPQGVYMLGRHVVVDGSNFKILIWTGAQLEVKDALPDPSAGTDTLQAGGGMTAQVWYFRIRTRDNETGTESAPDTRTGTADFFTTAGGNLAVRITAPSFNVRVTHWQVQMAPVVDTPSQYEIHTNPLDSVGGSSVDTDDEGTGWIPVATTEAFYDEDPASGDRFEYRTVGAVSVYRHSNPPAAAHVVHYKGRAVYCAHDDTWVVLSEPENPENFYHDTADEHVGFNTIDGESLVDTIVSPCTALAATENRILYFHRGGIVVIEGSLNLSLSADNRSTVGARDIRSVLLTENTLGAISPSLLVLDQDVFFFSQNGPAVVSGGGIPDELGIEAIRPDWECRDPLYEHRSVVGYCPETDEVLFSFVSKTARSTGVPDVTLAFHRGKRQWSPPWDLDVTSWTLHRDQDDSSNEKGVRLFFGGPFGSMNEYAVGWGDGEDGSDADAVDLDSTSATATTATVSGKSWSTDEWAGYGLVLTDRTTGQRYYRTIKSNTGDTLTWEGSVTDSGGGWTLNIGGIRTQIHRVLLSPGIPYKVNRLRGHIQDQLSVLT